MVATSEAFRVFRRSTNRGSFGHREYFLMTRQGVTFKAQRVYDLPLNGEFLVPKDLRTNEHLFGSVGFEVQERLVPDAPAGVVAEVFKAPAIEANLNCLEMDKV